MAGLIGIETPRIETPPLRPLTPETSDGFAVIEFAERLGVELMLWQRYALLHGLELLPDGSYRFSTVLVLVARQSGKTTVAQVLSLWRMMQGRSMVLGTSTNLDVARESWTAAVELAEDQLADEVVSVKRGALDTSLTLANKSRYKTMAANRRGGRGLSVDLGIADELREHRAKGESDGFEAWAALSGATTARPNSQLWAFSNAGDSSAVVLAHLRELAIGFIETGSGDDSLCLLEWSASEGADIDDRQAWRQANPALGVTITERTLEGKAASLPPNVFRVEHLCQSVENLDGAIDLGAWKACADSGSTLDVAKERVALVLDVAPGGEHVSLVAAWSGEDGRTRLSALAGWSSTEEARMELPGWIQAVEPEALGWFPSGPTAALGPMLRELGAHGLTGQEVTEACMGLADLVTARRIIHPADPLLDAHIAAASKLPSGDGWRFVRRGAGNPALRGIW